MSNAWSAVSNIAVQHPAPAIVGTTTTFTATAAGWILSSIPALQFVALIVAIVSGVITSLWYFRQLHAEQIKAAAIVAADMILARAKVIAVALDKAS
jgi:hypothetical protein